MTDLTTLVSDLLTQIDLQFIIGHIVTGAANAVVATLLGRCAPKMREPARRLARRAGLKPRRDDDQSGART